MKDKNKKHCECEEEKCDESCKCGCQDNDCGCGEGQECTCGEECNCHKEEKCGCDDCDCEKEECEDDCGCHEHECHCHHGDDMAGQYLAMAQRLQADFDNYRKHVAEQLDFQRQEGIKSVIEVFLPSLDTFKEAKKSIADENVLAGINMIEDKIVSALKKVNVEKIEAIGKNFDHNLHEVIAIMSDESKENDVILDEFQAGYTLNGKVIRYSKVIVNKKGE